MSFDWLSDYERARAMCAQASGASLNAGGAQQLASMRASVDGLEQQLRSMERSPGAFGITRTELARRKEMLESLRVQVSALSQGGGQAGSARLQQQKDVMREHDRLVSELEKGVGRLHTQSVMIHDEAALHVRLLNDMDSDADRAAEGLRAEARHADKIRAKSKNFWLYVTILVLVLILVFLIVLGFS